MANIFLSYDRDDAAKARSIALTLEKAGHSVWWDRHIKGGAQYAREIEQALAAADAIVVLWSADSVESAWVRDEAAAGRDSGRLVPVTLDGTPPPLGFRQFQAVDFSAWTGRRKPPRFAELQEAIDAAGTAGRSEPAVMPVKARKIAEPQKPNWVVIAGIAILIAIALWIAKPWERRSGGAHTVAITAPDPAAEPLARDLLSNLGNIRSVQTGSVRLLGEASKGRPDLIFEAGAAGTSGGAKLVLAGGKDRSILWSKDFGQESGTPADLMLQMTYTAGRVLGCALEGLEPGGKALRAQTLKLYLTGCSQFAEGNDETVSSAVPIFEQVVREVPRFKAAWAKLLLAQSNVVVGGSDIREARDALRRQIAQARRLDPQMPEATLAEVILLPGWAYGDSLRLLDQAREKNPENAVVFGHRAVALMNVGRLSEAIEDAREAARLDPTSPDAHGSYVLSLAHSGRIEAARSEMQRAERQWAGTGRLEELRHAFSLRYGDPKDLLTTAEFREANPRLQMYYRTRADPTPANVDRFIDFLQGLYSRRGLTAADISGHAQAYGELGREDDLYDLIFRFPAGGDLSQLSGVLFRPSLRGFRHDPRFMIVAKRIGLVDYWTKSGKWPDFCFDPDQPYDCKVEAAKLG